MTSKLINSNVIGIDNQVIERLNKCAKVTTFEEKEADKMELCIGIIDSRVINKKQKHLLTTYLESQRKKYKLLQKTGDYFAHLLNEVERSRFFLRTYLNR